MGEIFIELHLVRARVALSYGIPPGARDSVLARHGMSEASFQEFIDQYVEHPETFSELLSQVMDRLTDERHRQGLPGGSLVPSEVSPFQDGLGFH